MRSPSMYIRVGKRLLDLLLVIPALLLLLPVYLLVGLTVRIKLGTPVIFRQQRPGFRGELFEMMKFRTMTDERDAKGDLLPDSKRLTSFGKMLRSTSLDELPELLHVLTGEMSLVGPRPLLPAYLPRYTPEQARRHEVRPGLTGWAQVNGRNAVDWPERFKLDVWYVDHISLLLDLRIIFLTIAAIVSRNDINRPGEATMTEFMGNDPQ